MAGYNNVFTITQKQSNTNREIVHTPRLLPLLFHLSSSFSLGTYLKNSLLRHKPSRDLINFGGSPSGGKVRIAPSIDVSVNFVPISFSSSQ